jgi:hypothetical protein
VQISIPNEDFDPRLQQNGDDSLLVKFEIRPRMHRIESEKEGRPIYHDAEYISIRAPGSPDEVCRPVTQRDIDRFPRHYKAFKNRTGDEELLEGTLLSEWPAISRSQAEELAFLGIKTVEHLSTMSDANGQGLMGFNGLKRRAKEWLEIANAPLKARELQEQLAMRDDQIAKLQEQVDNLTTKPRKKKVTAKKAVDKPKE